MITAAEIDKVPGTVGDPLAVVQNFAGVARAAACSAACSSCAARRRRTRSIFARRASRSRSSITSAGCAACCPIGVIDSLEFYPGNFSPMYGRATGGIVDVQHQEAAAEEGRRLRRRQPLRHQRLPRGPARRQGRRRHRRPAQLPRLPAERRRPRRRARQPDHRAALLRLPAAGELPPGAGPRLCAFFCSAPTIAWRSCSRIRATLSAQITSNSLSCLDHVLPGDPGPTTTCPTAASRTRCKLSQGRQQDRRQRSAAWSST